MAEQRSPKLITVGAVATAYVNGKIVTSASPAPQVAVSVTTEIAATFVTDPGASTTNPNKGATVQTTAFTYEGTEPVTTTYVWKRNGSAILGQTASSYTTVQADVGTTLSARVTIDNAFGPAQFRDVSFGVVQDVGQTVDVQFIRLWTGIGPSGEDVTENPPFNATLYAYAYYDAEGTVLITDTNTVWYEGEGIAPSFTGTPSPSAFDPIVGAALLTVENLDAAGDPAPVVEYLWSDASTGATFDTTGLVGTAVTCDVKLTNIWGESATVTVDFGTVQAVPTYPDWQSSPYVGQFIGTTSVAAAVNITTPSTIYDAHSANAPVSYEKMGWDSATQLRVTLSPGNSIDTTTATAAYPFAVYWNPAHNQWYKMDSLDRIGAKTTMIYGQNASEGYGAFNYNFMDDAPQTLLIYAADPGDVSGWPAYV